MSHGNAALSVVGEGGARVRRLAWRYAGWFCSLSFMELQRMAASWRTNARPLVPVSIKSYCAARSSGGLEGHDERAKVID